MKRNHKSDEGITKPSGYQAKRRQDFKKSRYRESDIQNSPDPGVLPEQPVQVPWRKITGHVGIFKNPERHAVRCKNR